MTNSQTVYDFLTSVRNRAISTTLSPEDLASLQQLQLLQVLGADQYLALQQQVASLGAVQGTLSQEEQERAQLVQSVDEESDRTHSIRFHFEGAATKDAALSKEAQDTASLRNLDTELSAREQQFNQLLAQKSLLDTLVPCAGGYVALTGAGQVQLREMAVRLYRVSDLPFTTYIQQVQQVDRELNELADRAAQYAAGLAGPLGSYDRSAVWALSIGLAKLTPNVAEGSEALVAGWQALGRLAHNEENRLLAAEILTSVPRPLEQSLPAIEQLDHDVRHLGVPKDSSLGVAAMLLLGQRADGTFATANLAPFLALTRSYESAALLAIVNRPLPDLQQKFQTLRAMFAGWGFQPSEDVELASSFLTVSELPVQGLDTKLAILTRGMGQYLQFPLVASAILAAIPTLEANETLHLVEQAYEVVGRRAGPMSEPELITLAVRLLHGIRDETIGHLDTTATAAPPAPVGGGYLYGPRFFFMPGIVAHAVYFSTFSGVGGVHPAHVSVMGGFGG